MNGETRSSYTEITNLDGGLFDFQQRRVVPLEAFRMNGPPPAAEGPRCTTEEPPCVTGAGEPAPGVHGARFHSLSPIAMTSTASGDARRPRARMAPWAAGAGVVVGVASLMVAGALVPSNRTHALDRAQAQVAFTPLLGLGAGEVDVSSEPPPVDDQETETTPAPAEAAATWARCRCP
jgi:hypothetical protein